MVGQAPDQTFPSWFRTLEQIFNFFCLCSVNVISYTFLISFCLVFFYCLITEKHERVAVVGSKEAHEHGTKAERDRLAAAAGGTTTTSRHWPLRRGGLCHFAKPAAMTAVRYHTEAVEQDGRWTYNT